MVIFYKEGKQVTSILLGLSFIFFIYKGSIFIFHCNFVSSAIGATYYKAKGATECNGEQEKQHISHTTQRQAKTQAERQPPITKKEQPQNNIFVSYTMGITHSRHSSCGYTAPLRPSSYGTAQRNRRQNVTSKRSSISGLHIQPSNFI